MTAHHKIPRKERPDLELDENNCEAICRICHNREHPEKGGPGEREALPSGIRVIVVK